MNLQRYTHQFIVLFFITIIIATHCFSYIGHYGFDDMLFAQLSADVLHGKFNWNEHFTYRFPTLFLTALSYYIFGITDFASALPSVVINSIGVLIVHVIVRKQGVFITVLVLSVYVQDCWTLFYMDKLMADSYLTVSVIITMYALHKHKFDGGEANPLRYAALFSAGIILGFLAKEDMILLVIPYTFLMIIDIVKKRNILFWKYASLFIILFLVVYLTSFYFINGNAFSRLKAIYSNEYLNNCSYSHQPIQYLINRLSIGFVEVLNVSTMLLCGVVVIGYLFSQQRFTLVLGANNSADLFISFFIVGLLAANFMSVSITSYSPMCPDIRHFMYLVPVGAIAFAPIVKEHVLLKNSRIFIGSVGVVLTVIALYFKQEPYYTATLLTALLLIIFTFINSNYKYKKAMFLVGFITIQGIFSYTNYTYACKIKYRTQQQVLSKFVREHPTANIISDEILANIIRYYAGFGNYSNCISYEYFQPNIDSCIGNSAANYLVMNGHTLSISGNTINTLPMFVRAVDTSNATLVIDDATIDLKIYKLRYNAFDVKVLINDTCTFEVKSNKYWYVDAASSVKDQKYAGSFSSKVAEYSATFAIPTDSILCHSTYHKLSVGVNTQCLTKSECSAKIIISLENELGSYHHIEQPIAKYVTAQGNWYNAFVNDFIPFSVIKPHSVLKIYIYNPDKQWLYTDDFTVNLSLK